MNKKIFITGGNGFVGNSLIKLLESKKSFDIINTGDIGALNLCELDSVLRIPKSDVIVHLASKSFVPDSFNDPESFYSNNFISTLNILEKARREGSKVIFFSTYVYGTPRYLPIDENHITKPLNPYTQSKLICEDLCRAYNRDFGIPVTIFRPFNIYGPRQNSSFFIPTIINQVDNEIIKLNDSRPKRDFIFIDDVIEAVYLSIIKEEQTFQIFNLGTGKSTSIKDVVNMIVTYSCSKAQVIFSEKTRQGEVLDTVADISKITNELFWLPKTTIENGIKNCIINRKTTMT